MLFLFSIISMVIIPREQILAFAESWILLRIYVGFCFFFFNFGEMLDYSYKLAEAILLIYLRCIKKTVILPSIYKLFLLHVSRSGRFLSNIFFLLLFIFISSMVIQNAFITWYYNQWKYRDS